MAVTQDAERYVLIKEDASPALYLLRQQRLQRCKVEILSNRKGGMHPLDGCKAAQAIFSVSHGPGHDQPASREASKKAREVMANAKLGSRIGEIWLEIHPRTIMKGQWLADFIVECTIPPQETKVGSEDVIESHPWVIHVNGSANETRSGIGIILESLDSLISEQALLFGFKASNTVV